jgi:hypothetical protein
MLRWLFGRRRPAPTEPPALQWGDLWTAPPSRRTGTFRGTLLARPERTTAGCTMMPGEVHPTLLLLHAEGRSAPLKWLDPDREATLAAVRPEKATWITDDPLLLDTDAPRLGAAIGDEVELTGVAYPMYMAGTIVGIKIWGLYVRGISTP